jgi:GNAT superfamily N-acetyltransferase
MHHSDMKADSPDPGTRIDAASIGRITRLDKLGRPFEVEERGIECLPELMDMYEVFHPRAISQGLPPAREVALHQWVRRLLDRGWNFVCTQDGGMVGHAAVLADRERADGEFIVFVLQAYRNKGLGTVLTELALQRSRLGGLHTMWLTVEAFNFRAIRVYKKKGFEFCDEGERERTMVLKL